MDQQFVAAFAVVAAATVAIVQALKPKLPPDTSAIAALAVGIVLMLIYVVLPTEESRVLYLYVIGLPTGGSAAIAVATRVGSGAS